MRQKILLAALGVALISACGETKKPGSVSDSEINVYSDTLLSQIYDWRDRRMPDSLYSYFDHQQEQYAGAAVSAFLEIEDSMAISHLEKALQHPSSSVRQKTAQALGQQRSSQAAVVIRTAISREEDPSVGQVLWEALGKTGADTDLEYLVSNYSPNMVPDLQKGIALGLYRFALQGKVDPQGTALVVDLLKVPEASYYASAYLARTRGIDLLPFESKIWQNALAGQDVHRDINLARAMAKMAGSESGNWMKKFLKGDAWDYRIQVEALRSLPAFSGEEWPQLALDLYATDLNPNVKLQLARYFQEKGLPAQAKNYRTLGLDNFGSRSGPEFLAAAWKYAPNAQLKDSITADIKQLVETESSPYRIGWGLKALAHNPDNWEYLLKFGYAEQNRLIRGFCTEALIDCLTRDKALSKKQKQSYLNYFMAGVEGKDVALVSLCASALRNPDFDFSSEIKDLGFLDRGAGKLKLPRDTEAYLEIQKTKAFLEGNEYQDEAPKWNHPIDWEHVRSIRPDSSVIVETAKGQIVLQLDVETCPGSVSNFLKLAAKGFFNEKNFHRVVPDFVAQGGCPRGDGWGSVDYTLRSEFGNMYYGEGSLGMASAGKDTEGCQWFITHSPTPHLDGRYSLFGKVTQGMEVVHQLEIGDKMRISFAPTPPTVQ